MEMLWAPALLRNKSGAWQDESKLFSHQVAIREKENVSSVLLKRNGKDGQFVLLKYVLEKAIFQTYGKDG